MSKKENNALLDVISISLLEQSLKMNLYLGNEIYIANNIFELLETEKACSINNTSYVLFEMPLNAKPLNLYNVIYDMLHYKLVPVLAHPERYTFVQNNIEIIYDLIKKGVLMQANYGSIIGQYGQNAKIIVKKLIKNHMIHFLGTDVHKEKSIYPHIPQILCKIEEIIGRDNLEMITTVNPKLALENKKINIIEPKKIQLSFKDKLMMKRI